MEFKLISIESGVKTTVTANSYNHLITSVLDKEYQFKLLLPKATKAQSKILDLMIEGAVLKFDSVYREWSLTGYGRVNAKVAENLMYIGFVVMTESGGWSYTETYSINENIKEESGQ